MKKTLIYLVVHAEDILFAAQTEKIAKRLIKKACKKNAEEEDDYQIDMMEMVVEAEEDNYYKVVVQNEMARCQEMIPAVHQYFRDSLFHPDVVDRDFGKEEKKIRISQAKKIVKKHIANLRLLRHIKYTAD